MNAREIVMNRFHIVYFGKWWLTPFTLTPIYFRFILLRRFISDILYEKVACSLNIRKIIMKALHYTAFTLLVVGGLNWLLVGAFRWDIGQLFGGMGSPISRIIYILVGLSAIIIMATHKRDCNVCSMGMDQKM